MQDIVDQVNKLDWSRDFRLTIFRKKETIRPIELAKDLIKTGNFVMIKPCREDAEYYRIIVAKSPISEGLRNPYVEL